MGTLCMIIGESGTGKSTAMRNLDPKKTFVISALNKAFPFKGWKSKYKLATKENPKGNYFVTDSYPNIKAIMEKLSKDRPEVETLVIDDFQYLMANEFMRRHADLNLKGNAVFGLYNDIADHAWNLIMDAQLCRENLDVFFLCHSDEDEFGKTRAKTIGKLLNDKITLEGMFTIVLESKIRDGKYFFITQNNGANTAKSPMDMFESLEIDNDLEFVKQKIKEYNT